MIYSGTIITPGPVSADHLMIYHEFTFTDVAPSQSRHQNALFSSNIIVPGTFCVLPLSATLPPGDHVTWGIVNFLESGIFLSIATMIMMRDKDSKKI